MWRIGTVCWALCAGLLVACSDRDAQQQITPAGSNSVTSQPALQAPINFQVLDKFEVGNQVFVRSLATTDSALWVGTSVGALQISLADFQIRNSVTRQNGLANEYVFALMPTAGGVWFGTNGGGASYFDGSQWKTYFPMHGLADYWVYAFAEQENDLWIGTWYGLSRLNKQSGKFTTYVKELVNEWVYGLAVDGNDNLWVGTEGGINMFDGSRWHVWTHQDGLGAPNSQNLPPSRNTGLGTRQRHDLTVMADGGKTYNPNYVFCVLAPSDGKIWAGTWGGGVSVYDGKTWRNYTRKDNLGGNIVYSLAEDQQGRIWAGTDGGVSVYFQQQWHALAGITRDHVYAIATDKKNIWIGLRGAVLRVGPLQVNRRKP